MNFYLISYDIISENNDDADNTAIYRKIDNIIEELDNTAKRLLGSQWVIKSNTTPQDICGYTIDKLFNAGYGNVNIKLVITPIRNDSYAYPSCLKQKLLAKLDN